MNNISSFEGTKQDLYNYLVETLHIQQNKPSKKGEMGNFELISLKDQIERIYSTSDKTGKIYYTSHYFEEEYIKETNETIKNEAFAVCIVNVKITD